GAESLRSLLTIAVQSTQAAPPLAFAGPDDGWILGADSTLSPELLHLDAQGWVDCGPIAGPRPQRCGDRDGHTTLQATVSGTSADKLVGLVSAGSRVYLYGYRVDSTSSLAYPLILWQERGGQWSADPAGGGYDPLGPPGAGRGNV